MKKASKPPAGTGTGGERSESPLFTSLLDSDPEKEDSDDGSNDDEPVRPRGKLASRMLAAHDAKATKKSETAYERVKESIFGGNSTPQSGRDHGSDAEMEDGDDEEALFSTSRRKKTPTKKKSTPSSKTTPKPKSPARDSASLPADEDSDEEAPLNLFGNQRFLALVAKKRAERQAQEAAEAEKRKNRAKLDAQLECGPSDEDDSSSENLQSQRAPTRRRAGKKALEEMHKETQRMARSMQLTHQATTRKKITKQSLFDKFSFRPKADEKAAVVDSRYAGVLWL